MAQQKLKIAVIGCGLVGASWALVYARAGCQVVIYDQSVQAAQAALDFVRTADDTAWRNCEIAQGLSAALLGADYVQESAPEELPLKQALYREIDRLLLDGVNEGAIIGSSTSGLPASSFTDGLQCAARCLVVHPINPPHLVPLVELVPAPWTAPATLHFAHQLMIDVGQKPITLTREINGFVVNRLQSALLGEAFRLVEDGICTPQDVDAAVADGLGLRWCFMGPFATIDLNAANGVAEYCARFGPMYYALAKEQADPREWHDGLVSNIEAALRGTVTAADLPARRHWRDRFLAAVIEAKQHIAKELDASTDKPLPD